MTPWQHLRSITQKWGFSFIIDSLDDAPLPETGEEAGILRPVSELYP